MSPYLLFLPFLVWGLFLILGSAWFKGKLGEFKVNVGLSFLLDPKVYRLVKNVTLPIADGTTQIDHLVISPYGIFVIETKNIKGWIFGLPTQARWTQVIFHFKKRFQNPLLQNKLHVKAVRELLGLKSDQVHNVVVFVGACTFKTRMPPEVLQGVGGLAGFIRKKSRVVFTEDEVRRFTKDILTHRLGPGFLTERTHVRNVKRKISENKAISKIACPRCGGAMIKRVNRRSGEWFLGCRRFPGCTGARSIN